METSTFFLYVLQCSAVQAEHLRCRADANRRQPWSTVYYKFKNNVLKQQHRITDEGTPREVPYHVIYFIMNDVRTRAREVATRYVAQLLQSYIKKQPRDSPPNVRRLTFNTLPMKAGGGITQGGLRNKPARRRRSTSRTANKANHYPPLRRMLQKPTVQKQLHSLATEIAMRGLAAAASLNTLRMDLDARIMRLNALRNWDQPEQRTPAWYEMRDNMITASDFGCLLGSERALESFSRNKASSNSALRAQRMGGASGSPACQHGVICEPVCKLVYEKLANACVEEFGLLRHASCPYIGASPDGICNELSTSDYIGRLVEFKAPYSRTIEHGRVPKKYLAQIQGQLEVTGMEACDYLECVLALTYEDADTHLETIADRASASATATANATATPPNKRGVSWYGIMRKAWGDSMPEYGAIGCAHDLPSNDNTEYRALWVLTDYNLITVRRNQQWFAEHMTPRLEKAWQSVQTNRRSSSTRTTDGERRRCPRKAASSLSSLSFR